MINLGTNQGVEAKLSQDKHHTLEQAVIPLSNTH